jgi:hypothetical protein
MNVLKHPKGLHDRDNGVTAAPKIDGFAVHFPL